MLVHRLRCEGQFVPTEAAGYPASAAESGKFPGELREVVAPLAGSGLAFKILCVQWERASVLKHLVKTKGWLAAGQESKQSGLEGTGKP